MNIMQKMSLLFIIYYYIDINYVFMSLYYFQNKVIMNKISESLWIQKKETEVEETKKIDNIEPISWKQELENVIKSQQYNQYIYNMLIMKLHSSDVIHDPKATAEDLMQEMWIKALLKIDQYKVGTNLKARLGTIAYNKMIDLLRSEKNREIQSIDDVKNASGELYKFELPDVSKNVEEIMINNEKYHKIRDIINQLPQEQRDVVIYRYYTDMSFKEISLWNF